MVEKITWTHDYLPNNPASQQQTAFSIIDRLWSEHALNTDAFFFSLFFCLVVAFLSLERIVVEEEENI